MGRKVSKECPPSAPVRQNGRIEQGKISGYRSLSGSGDETEIRAGEARSFRVVWALAVFHIISLIASVLK
jgi:hypothetical protein